jgi:hypothetical protein
MSRSSSLICRIANGDGRALPFSHRLIVGNVTPSLAANLSWVSPSLFLISHIASAKSCCRFTKDAPSSYILNTPRPDKQ